MGSADFQKAPKHHVAWYHVRWFHRFHRCPWKKTQIFFWKKSWNSTRQICFQPKSVTSSAMWRIGSDILQAEKLTSYYGLCTCQSFQFKYSEPWICGLMPTVEMVTGFVVSAFISCSDHKYGSLMVHLMVQMCCVLESAKLKIDKVWTLQTCLNIFWKSKFYWINGFGDSYEDRNIYPSTFKPTLSQGPSEVSEVLGQAPSW